MLRDSAYLLDILLMARDIRHFTAEMDKQTFLSDRKCQFAVIHCFEVIGEAVKRLSPEIKEQYAHVPWPAMARMRDLLIHAYDRVDLNRIWDTIQDDIPVLISTLDAIVPPKDKA